MSAKIVIVAAVFAGLNCSAQLMPKGILVPGYSLNTLPFALPEGNVYAPVTIDSKGNLYVASGFLGVVNSGSGIYKISASGIVSLFAGGRGNAPFLGDGGPAVGAQIDPAGIATDSAGNLYIADFVNNRIRKVDANGIISTIAGPGGGVLGDGGPATSATISNPVGIAIDATGNIFVTQPYHYRVRKISPGGIITTVAGNGQAAPNGQSATCACGDGGPADSATVPYPTSVAVDSGGNLFVADAGGTRIRRISANGIITTFAGNGNNLSGQLPSYGDGGSAVAAQLRGFNFSTFTSRASYAPNIVVDAAGSVYVPDNNQIRVITADGNINTIAGGGMAASQVGSVPATSVLLPYLLGLAVDSNGKIYFTHLGYTINVLVPSTTPVFPLPVIAQSISAGAFRNGGDLPPSSSALGGWMEIYGSYLAPDTRQWATTDFNGTNAPTVLDGTSVTIGGQPAFVSYISASQVNFQVPTNIGTGSQPVVIRTVNGTSITSAITVNAEQPALLSPPAFNINKSQYAVALFPDGVTYVLPSGAIPGIASRPANKGDTITLYGIGFGPTTPNNPSGQIVGPGNSLALPINATIGSTKATISYAGLVSGLIGLYQFNIVVPMSYSTVTPAQITLSLGSGISATLALSIQ